MEDAAAAAPTEMVVLGSHPAEGGGLAGCWGQEGFMISRNQYRKIRRDLGRGHRGERPSPEAKQRWLRVVLFARPSSGVKQKNSDRDLVNGEILSSDVVIISGEHHSAMPKMKSGMSWFVPPNGTLGTSSGKGGLA